MAALVPIKQSPLLIQLPNGALVPASGSGLVQAGAAPVAADADGTGALVQPKVLAAGDDPGAAPDASQATSIATLTPRGTGGAAKGALIDTPKQPDVMYQKDPTDGSGDMMALMSKLGALAGKTGAAPGADAGTSAPPTTAATNDNSPGIMDQLRGFFLGKDPNSVPGGTGPTSQDTTGATVPAATPVDVAQLAPATAAAQAPGTAVAPSGALDATIPVPTARPALATDPRSVQAPDMTPDPASLMPSAQTTALPQSNAEPGFFDKLRADPVRMALLTGGLSTMAAASRPGATPLGALGEGGLGGIKASLAMQDAAKQQALAEQHSVREDASEASQAQLRAKQGAFYDARTDQQPALTQAKTTTAGAAQTRAAAAMTRANNPFAAGGKGQSVFQQKQAAYLTAHPGDDQGALDYAAGHKKMGGGDIMKSSYSLANSELNGMITQPDDPKKWVDDRAAEIADKIQNNDGVKAAPDAAPPKGGAGPAFGDGSINKPAHPQSAADLNSLPSGAIYINPADNKPYKKK